MLWVTLQQCLPMALQTVAQIRFLKLKEMFEVVDKDGVSKFTMKRTLWVCGHGDNPSAGESWWFEEAMGVLPWSPMAASSCCLSCVQASFPLAPTLSPDTRVWGRNEYIRSGVSGSMGIHVYWVRKEITPKILDLGSATLGFPLGVTRSAFVLQIQKAGILQTCWAATLHLVKRRGPFYCVHIASWGTCPTCQALRAPTAPSSLSLSLSGGERKRKGQRTWGLILTMK